MYTYQVETPKPKVEFTGYMVEATSTIKDFDFASIHRSKQFNEAMEYFDKDDTMTRNILLSVNEADQNVVMQSLSNKLYKHITDKIDDIDFGTIPLSAGDITKIENYHELCDCVNIITQILQQYHQDTTPIEVVSTAISNMTDRIGLFTKAYKLNVEMPMIIYNIMALSIVSSVSFMISSCIEFVKLPDNNGFDLAVEKAGIMKTKDNVLFKDLAKWNNQCANGSFDKAMDYIMQGNSNSHGFTGAAAAGVAIGAILIAIPIIKELVFFFYYSRTKVADYFEAQANLLQMNAYNIDNTMTRDETDRKKIADKQRKIADRFKKFSDKMKVDNKTAGQKADKEMVKLSKEKFKANEVLDTIPDSSNAILF